MAGGTSFGFHQSGSSCLIEATSMHSNTSNTKVICFRTRLRFYPQSHGLTSSKAPQSGMGSPSSSCFQLRRTSCQFFSQPCILSNARCLATSLLSVRGVNYPTANNFSAAYQQKLQVSSDEILTLSIMNHGHGMTRDLHKLGSQVVQEHQSELHLIFPFISLHYHYYFLHLNLTSSP